MLRLRTLLTRSLAPAALCALAVTACGSSQHPATAPSAKTSAKAHAHDAHTVYIYSGLPLNGPQRIDSLQIEQGVRLELNWAKAHHQVGGYRIVFKPLNDSAPQPQPRGRGKTKASTSSRGWNQVATVTAAERAAHNPETVAYIGDLNSGATELSLPILNQAGIVQITPGSGYPGLTDRVPGVTSVTPPAEPGRYYPHSRGSLLRLIPNDVVQAADAINWLKNGDATSCHVLSAVQFGNDPESIAMVRAIEATARLYKLGWVSAPPLPSDTKLYGTYAAGLRAKGVNCFMLAGRVTPAAIVFTNELQSQLPPGSVIVGTSSMCSPRWTDQARGGVALKVDASLYCTTPVLRIASFLGGKQFSALFRSAYHTAPTAYDYWGYRAGTLLLKAIGDIGTPDIRQAVMGNLVNNVAGTYTFDSDGDLSGDPGSNYGLDRIVDGIPRPWKVLNYQKLLSES